MTASISGTKAPRSLKITGCRGTPCFWVAPHQQETRQLGRRRPAPNPTLCFIVDQTLTVERFGPKAGERGGGSRVRGYP